MVKSVNSEQPLPEFLTRCRPAPATPPPPRFKRPPSQAVQAFSRLRPLLRRGPYPNETVAQVEARQVRAYDEIAALRTARLVVKDGAEEIIHMADGSRLRVLQRRHGVQLTVLSEPAQRPLPAAPVRHRRPPAPLLAPAAARPVSVRQRGWRGWLTRRLLTWLQPLVVAEVERCLAARAAAGRPVRP